MESVITVLQTVMNVKIIFPAKLAQIVTSFLRIRKTVSQGLDVQMATI